MTVALITVGLLTLVLAIIAVHDLTQRQHAVTRNFPVIGHFRYFFEEIGQPLRQYFFAAYPSLPTATTGGANARVTSRYTQHPK